MTSVVSGKQLLWDRRGWGDFESLIWYRVAKLTRLHPKIPEVPPPPPGETCVDLLASRNKALNQGPKLKRETLTILSITSLLKNSDLF